MALQRYRFSNVPAAVDVAFSPTWGDTTLDAGSAKIQLTTGGSLTQSPDWYNGGIGNAAVVQAVGPADLPGGTLAGTAAACLRLQKIPGFASPETVGRLLVRVVSGDGATVRGTLIDATSAPLATAGRRTFSSTLTEVSTQAGDRLVVEYGGGPSGAASRTIGANPTPAGATTGPDAPFSDKDTTDTAERSWVDFDLQPATLTRRYYLRKTQVPAQTPSFSSWSVTSSAVRRAMTRSRFDASIYPSGADSNEFASMSFTKGLGGRQQTLGGQFVADDVLPAGPVKGTISAAVHTSGAMTFIDNRSVWRMVAKVVSGDGTIVRGILYAGPGLPSSENTMADNYWWHINETQWVRDVPMTEVVAQAGDRLVFEIGVDSSFDYDWPNFIFNYGAPFGRPPLVTTSRGTSADGTTKLAWVEFKMLANDRPLYVGADRVKKLYLGSAEVPHLKLGALNGF